MDSSRSPLSLRRVWAASSRRVVDTRGYSFGCAVEPCSILDRTDRSANLVLNAVAVEAGDLDGATAAATALLQGQVSPHWTCVSCAGWWPKACSQYVRKLARARRAEGTEEQVA